MKKGIVIAFPGIRYTCRQQLMQDCLAFYTARGYETLCLDFAGVPFDGTADMGRAAELALPSILGRLSGVRFADYTDVAFLAKSLGTLCAVRTAKVLGLRPRFFLLTPLEETLQELPQDAVEHGLPQEERLKNLLDKVRNPYCYLDNGIIVKLNFAPRGSSTLSERVGRCFQSAG